MFPHQKLDWNLRRLDKRLEEAPDDAAARLDLAAACLSKAAFHGGGEAWFNKALTHARRVLQSDPTSPAALVVAGWSLVEMDRPEPGARYLDEARKLAMDRADVHAALSVLHESEGDRHQAIRELESACRLAPDSWEANYLLERQLALRAEEVGRADGADASARLLERSMYHGVRALQLDPSPSALPVLLHDLGVGCLRHGRLTEAHKVFTRLLDHEKFRARGRFYLGLVLYRMGKYKNAIVFLRQTLDDDPSQAAAVWGRIGMCYLHLGEVVKARESCNKALAIEPTDLAARWALGCALLEEGDVDEATKTFREILAEAPDHHAAFAELVRLRVEASDRRWLRAALRTEVSTYDRLPLTLPREHRRKSVTPRLGASAGSRGGLGPVRHDARPDVQPRAATRERVTAIVLGLAEIDRRPVGANARDDGESTLATLLDAMDLTTDEGLRFRLWEAALDRLGDERAADAIARLEEPGRAYSAAAGRELLAVADRVPEPLLTRGLQISEDDLKRAAADRHGVGADVGTLRANVERERQEARAWQALLLLAIASGATRSGRSLLLRWSTDADPELADAARSALIVSGDTGHDEALRPRARARGAEALLDTLVARGSPADVRVQPRPVGADEDVCCATCGRRPAEVSHLIAGGVGAAGTAVCDRCIAAIARDRRELATDDPGVACRLCGRTNLEARGVYVYRAVAVCASCVDLGLGLVEREEIDRFLAAW